MSLESADEAGLPAGGASIDAAPRYASRVRARLTAPPQATAGALFSSGNAIGFLRFALAALVVFHHARVLGTGGADPILRATRGQADLGVLAVAGFFALSGFLITRSAEHVSVPRYLWHRVLRIMPAYWVCLVVIAIGVGPILWLADHGTVAGYLGAKPSAAGYVVHNAVLALGQTRIDDLLAGNRYPRTLDGSLWTLAYEFSWYLIVAALAATRLLRPRVVALLVLYVVVQAATGWHLVASVPVIGYPFGSRFAVAFACGMLAYLARERLPMDDRLGVLAGVVTLVTLRFGAFSSLGMVAYAYLALWAAWRIPFRRFGARHDVSYGLYIYAFPMQQVLARFLPRLPYLAFVAATFALTLPLAWLSHLLVEAPALRMKGADLPAIARSIARRAGLGGGNHRAPADRPGPAPEPEERP